MNAPALLSLLRDVRAFMLDDPRCLGEPAWALKARLDAAIAELEAEGRRLKMCCSTCKRPWDDEHAAGRCSVARDLVSAVVGRLRELANGYGSGYVTGHAAADRIEREFAPKPTPPAEGAEGGARLSPGVALAAAIPHDERADGMLRELLDEHAPPKGEKRVLSAAQPAAVDSVRVHPGGYACSSYSPLGRVEGPDGELGSPHRCATCGGDEEGHGGAKIDEDGRPCRWCGLSPCNMPDDCASSSHYVRMASAPITTGGEGGKT